MKKLLFGLALLCPLVAACVEDAVPLELLPEPELTAEVVTPPEQPSGDNNSNSISARGQFGLIPTGGVKFRTYPSGFDGLTNEDGSFPYESGDYVEFYLGETLLGSAKAAPIVSEYDLEGALGLNHDVSTRIAQVLQSLDDDDDLANGIFIPETFTPAPSTVPKVASNEESTKRYKVGIRIDGIDVWTSQQQFEAEVANFVSITQREFVATDEARARLAAIIADTQGDLENCLAPGQLDFFQTTAVTCRDRKLAWAFRFIVSPEFYTERKPLLELNRWNQERLEDQALKNRLAAIGDSITNFVSLAEATYKSNGLKLTGDQLNAFGSGFGAIVDQVLLNMQADSGFDPKSKALRDDVATIISNATAIAQCLPLFTAGTEDRAVDENKCRKELLKRLEANDFTPYVSDSLEQTWRYIRLGYKLREFVDYGRELKRLYQASSQNGPRQAELALIALSGAANAAEASINEVYELYDIEESEYTWTGQLRATFSTVAASADCAKNAYAIKREIATGTKARGSFSKATEDCIDAALETVNQITVASRTIVGGLIAKDTTEKLKESLLAEAVVAERYAYGQDLGSLHAKWGIGASVGFNKDALIRAMAEQQGLREDRYGIWDFGIIRGDEYDLEDVRLKVRLAMMRTEGALIEAENRRYGLPDTAEVWVNGATAREDAGEIIFKAYLSHPLEDSASVRFDHLDIDSDNRAPVNTDYVFNNGLVTFDAGQTEAEIRFALIDDSLSETTEHFAVELSLNSAQGTTDNLEIRSSIATGIILDDDPVSYSYTDQSIERLGGLLFLLVNSSQGTEAVLYDPLKVETRKIELAPNRSASARVSTFQGELLVALEKPADNGYPFLNVWRTDNAIDWRLEKTIPHCRGVPSYYLGCRVFWLLTSETEVAFSTRIGFGDGQQSHFFVSWLSDRESVLETDARGPIVPALSGGTLSFVDNNYRFNRVNEGWLRQVSPDGVAATLIGQRQTASFAHIYDGEYRFMSEPAQTYFFSSDQTREPQTCTETQSAPTPVIRRATEAKDQNTMLRRVGNQVNGAVIYTYYLYEYQDIVGCRLKLVTEFALPDGFQVQDGLRVADIYYAYGYLPNPESTRFPALAEIDIQNGTVNIIRPVQ